MSATAKPHARDRDLWETMVNSKWGGQQPVLSPEESIAAAKKLYRHATGKTWPGAIELTSGNRYTWARRVRGKGLVLFVNPDKREVHARGLRALIHDISHYCHRQLHPQDSAHSIRQVRLERNLVDFALARDWTDGALKPKPKAEPAPKAKPDVVQQRYARMVSRRDKWQREADRAKRLLTKAAREVREYERRHRDRLGLGE